MEKWSNEIELNAIQYRKINWQVGKIERVACLLDQLNYTKNRENKTKNRENRNKRERKRFHAIWVIVKFSWSYFRTVFRCGLQRVKRVNCIVLIELKCSKLGVLTHLIAFIDSLPKFSNYIERERKTSSATNHFQSRNWDNWSKFIQYVTVKLV